MKRSFKIITAALLLSSAVAGGAFAQQVQPDEGDYYQGVDPNPVINRRVIVPSNDAAAVLPDEGDYYAGAERLPQVDSMRTGSIDSLDEPVPYTRGEGEYYEGVNPPTR
ncbi:hypothetical protein [Pararhizobium sp.]|uniref:hypothetical protein n=1 Tax=Pararhizobium sp. TaxID=1977563 RepID=UPI00271F9BFE|nr:hypothetical protein [Pararhizobium sp.]MDO9418811.1 hypothetical protein [Pararhizobium sp.]